MWTRQRFFHVRVRPFHVSFHAEVIAFLRREGALFSESDNKSVDGLEFGESLFDHAVVKRLYLWRLLAFDLQAYRGVVVDMDEPGGDGAIGFGYVFGVPVAPPFRVILQTVSNDGLLPLENYTSPVVPPYLKGPPQQGQVLQP